MIEQPWQSSHPSTGSSTEDAERLLGRLIILVNTTFLDTGFVPHDAHSVPTKSDRVPRRVGATALRYAAPRLQDEPVALRLRALRMHVVFYVCVPRSAAPLLSGGLDGTARAIELWSTLQWNLSVSY
jgi:hypothetical protein